MKTRLRPSGREETGNDAAAATIPALVPALVLASALALAGCGGIGKRVNAYERGMLAKTGMQLVEDKNERPHFNHMLNAREGSFGGFGGAGGGCGCN